MAKKIITKSIACLLAFSIVTSSILSPRGYAITSQHSPEFSQFQSVGSSGLVNDFTGAFSYSIPVISIPGTDGGGYALTLSYSSDLSPQADASWVGYGWNLNPGAIVRNKNGFADDVNAGSVTNYNKAPVDIHCGLGISSSLEIFSFDLGLTASANATWSNYYGIKTIGEVSVGASAYGCSTSLSYTTTGEHSFGASVNPAGLFKSIAKIDSEGGGTTYSFSGDPTTSTKMGAADFMRSKGSASIGLGSNSYLSNRSFATRVSSFVGFSTAMSLSVQGDATPLHIGVGGSINASLNINVPADTEVDTYYGYLYSHNATKGDDILMDYYVEKEAPYNQRDYYLGIPFSGADNFYASAYGMNGSIRVCSKTAGHFRANKASSSTTSYSIGNDINAGTCIGSGLRVDGSEQLITSDEWYDDDAYRFNNDYDESYYFMFNGDLGSSVDFGGTNAVAFSMKGNDDDGYTPVAPEGLYETANDNIDRMNRSSYIGYHTIEDMQKIDSDGKNYKRYNNRSDIETLANRTAMAGSENLKSQIGEFSITNESGNNYLYGLPVYVKNEKSISYTIEPTTDYIAYDQVELDVNKNPFYLGESYEGLEQKYANTWLLTQITTPNYIDVGHNGPDSSDFGGWTKFNYTKVYGESKTAWYHYRTPYSGVFNNIGVKSDPSDDKGSYSSGDKEIYYVESIETKTHIAKFSTSDREDGYDAELDVIKAVEKAARGTHKSQRLDTIKLYSKNIDGSETLIQSVYFNYDYSAFPGDPSNASGGKLTLKSIYTEYNNVVGAKVSPYLFNYVYPSVSYPAPFDTLDNDYSLYSETNQNPPYDILNTDRWGFYQYGGKDRYENMMPWVDQTPDEANFDPAAWLLKSIQLPSGGEIHVLYEQNQYMYVQDKRATVMVSIKEEPTLISEADDYENAGFYKYKLNLEDIGLDGSEPDAGLNTYYVYLYNTFVKDEDAKIYFKILYNLLPFEDAKIDECGSEYIDGYVKVRDVQFDGTDIFIVLGDGDKHDLSEETSENYTVPSLVCLDFYNQRINGKISFNSGPTGCAVNTLGNDLSESSSASDIVNFIYDFAEAIGTFTAATSATGICALIDQEHSYLRIPVPDFHPKKGGGVRVKRIITYAKGLEDDAADAVVHGQEYIYLDADSMCSGVATNEPSLGREENALINYLNKRKETDWAQKIISGDDKEQFEGPIGASLLPAPSIGYSRIAVRSLYDSPTKPAMSVKEFYTCKDKPSITCESTTMDKKSFWLPIPAVPVSTNITKLWSTQGYSFILSDWHGKIKHEATYSGDNNNIATNLTLLTENNYSYYTHDDVRTISEFDWNNLEPYEENETTDEEDEHIVPGQHTEVVMESREVVDVKGFVNVEGDVSIGIWGTITVPYVPFMVYADYTENNIRTHVTNKITYKPVLLKAVSTYQDGVLSKLTNQYFDKNTGAPVITSTYDDYQGMSNPDEYSHNGYYYNFNFLAPNYYTDMGTKSTNEQMRIESADDFNMDKLVEDNDGDGSNEYYLSLSGSSICDNLDFFTPGSLIALYAPGSETPDIYNIGVIEGSLIELLPTNYYWHNNTTDSPESVSVEILLSGKTNQLNASVGNITSYGGLPTATSHEIDKDELALRELIVLYLNKKLDGGSSVSLSSSEMTLLENLNVTNPSSGECESFAGVFGNDFKLEFEVDSHYYTETVCDTIPAHYDSCDPIKIGEDENGNPIYKPNCELIPEEINCHDEVKKNNVPILTLSSGSSDGDGCDITFKYVEGYAFFLDDKTHEVMYGNEESPCDAVRINCIDFCPDGYDYTTLDKIVAAGSITLSDDWAYNNYIKDAYNIDENDNVYETAQKGNWNVAETYAYKTSVSSITDTKAYTYNTAIFDDFTVFNWEYSEANDADKWINSNIVEYYSPFNLPLQEKNILDIRTSAKYGYNKTLPYAVASNAPYSTFFFESFENYVDNSSAESNSYDLEDGYKISTNASMYDYGKPGSFSSETAHSGKQSYKLDFTLEGFPNYQTQIDLANIELNDQLRENGLVAKIWIKNNATLNTFQLKMGEPLSANKTIDFEKIARVGEWELYQASTGKFESDKFSILSWSSVTDITPSIYINVTKPLTGSLDFYIDDVRMQPSDAQMITYVYDSNYRLITQFDDQNFGLFYQYNDEGKLIRKQIETERGLKMITETLYNIPTVSKSELK